MVGYTLIMAGVTRIIEVSFIVPKYTPLSEGVSDDNRSDHTLAESSSSTPIWQAVKSFRHLPPFVCFLDLSHCLHTDNSGEAFDCSWVRVSRRAHRLRPHLHFRVLFMSATDEELRFADNEGMDHVTYVLIMFR